jgi:ribonuclease HI
VSELSILRVNDVKAVYTDGGLLLKNPSPVGGMWAFRMVDHEDRLLDSGVIYEFSAGIIKPGITNNVTEYIAAAKAFELLPEGWSGIWRPDSEVTIERFLGRYPGMNLPRAVKLRGERAWARLNNVQIELLGGHPTKKELISGFRKKDGKPVSIHNVWCDKACTARGIQLKELWDRGVREGSV